MIGSGSLLARKALGGKMLATAAAAVLGLGLIAQPVPLLPTAAAQAAEKDDKTPDFDKVVEGMQKIDGMFTLYRPTGDALEKSPAKLLAVIPRSLLNQDLLLATSLSQGPLMGYQWSDYLVRWEQRGKKLVLAVPDMRYVTDDKSPVSAAVERTYTQGFLTSLPIITRTRQGDPVVDLGDFLVSQTIRIPGASGALRKELSRYTKVKAFENNMLVDVEMAFSGTGGSGRMLGISYGFRRLPKLGSDGFTPRKADERVGYFNTVRQDWNTKYDERETKVRYINRWNLQKLDPSLEMSPPKKPIVFVIEKTVPIQWRRYVRDGILEWNKAYEEIGITGAIVVQQQTDDNEFADVDPENADYNFIRWIVTGRGFAMGPSRADPRTGQILDADIIFDDAMLRYYVEDVDIFGPKALVGLIGPEAAEFYADNPQFMPMGMAADEISGIRDEHAVWQTHHGSNFGPGELLRDDATAGHAPVANRAAFNPHGCSYADGLRHQLAISALAAAKTADGKVPERVLGQVIKEIIAHEVGHTIGLRHNFKASAWLELEEVRRRRDAGNEPTTASVMDYNPLLFFPGDKIEDVGNLMTPAIGPYDFWAVEYGYRIPSKDDGPEEKMLAKIASRSTEPGLAYATDEDVRGFSSPDPLANRFDYTSDPVAWAKMRIQLADSLMADLEKWAVNGEDPNEYLRQVFSQVMFERVRNLSYVSRMPGGQYFSRSRAGDKDAPAPLAVVPAKMQRDALDMLAATAFSDDFFAVEAELLNRLPTGRWSDWETSAASRIDFPVHEYVLRMQNMALAPLMNPMVLQRIYDAELKQNGEDRYSVAEHLSRLQTIVWGELKPTDKAFKDAEPMLPSLRRNLQKQHLDYLLAIAKSEPGGMISPDLHSMVSYTLRELAEDIGRVLENGQNEEGWRIDLASRAHLNEAKRRIERTLDAPLTAGGSGGMPTIILQLGQETQGR
ncbi:MAG: zinc-dependent metalloprotease [Phycisphaerae bacterium]